MKTYAADFETFYSKDISINEQGVFHYLRHPDNDIYMVSIAGDDGFRFVGHPKEAPWRDLEGSIFLSHNVGFDSAVFYRLQELGIVPDPYKLTAWHDTADLAAFLAVPRSLKSAASILLGVAADKDVRDKMKGQRWENMTPEFQEEVRKYALKDAELCLELWQKYSDKWPKVERQISHMTAQMAYKGVPLDREALEAAKTKLEVAVWEAEALIPWAKDSKVLSPIAVRAECAKNGIPCPKSLAQDDPEAEAWEEAYAEKYSWIGALRNYRKSNKHLKTVCTMLGRLRPDGTMAYGLKYFGAHTGRDSGESGWNAQNMPKGEIVGVNLRSLVKAGEGKTFVNCDLSQIEPRVLHWLAGDTHILQYIRESTDLYEAQARAWGLYSEVGALEATNPALRHQIKGLAIGLGYGMSAKKFSEVAGVDLKEAERLVTLYRSKNPLVLKLWKRLERVLTETSKSPTDKHAYLTLPSGRQMTYWNVSNSSRGPTAEFSRNGTLIRLSTWGGSLSENITQAVARDVFMYQCLELTKQGLPPCLRIHDEVLIEVDEAKAVEALSAVQSIMSTGPSWATGLPLAAKGQISKIYKK